ncbi:MAG: DNA repair protein RecN [Candidatus Palauibacterales bacterium]|nr:DNA repair protein RecN [Candidatus Palauibacterales bacterium]MDP2483167.1 DNA repair protein RecN [Candidatus Palauibacterales bacterium]
MLKELHVRDYAVIDDLRLDLQPGLNVLTGETGAGKSLIVGAVSLLLGDRASSDVVRAGRDRALVEGVFDCSKCPELVAACEEQGIEVEGGWLILRREVVREGRNRAWVNGSPATAALVRRLGAGLVDLHGQHEHQALLQRDAQRDILDSFAGATEAASGTDAAHRRLADVRRRIAATRSEASATRERADYLEFRAREIEEAALQPGEDGAAASEARRLEHSEELMELSASLHSAVYSDDGSLVDRLGSLGRRMEDLVRIDPAAEEIAELYAESRNTLEELGRRLSVYHSSVEHDPERLAALRERLDLIHRLKRKYGDTVEAVISAGREARDELDAADRSALDLAALAREEELALEELQKVARSLTDLRRKAARRLEAEVTGLLGELGMEGGRFEVELEELEVPGPHGSERVSFLVSLNPGFDPGPLARVASGGELSRVMLALKTVLAEVDDVPTLVFDEIDSGVGGRVAHQVAERLAMVAGNHQVFAVTHLPQIASRASTHLHVEKVQADGLAAARVRTLDGEERVEELARMLGGKPGRETARRHAAELLSE